jgi:hypothetical protein
MIAIVKVEKSTAGTWFSKQLSIDILVCLGTILTSLTWTLSNGKDMNWDQLNYHFYSPFSFLEQRFSTDFIAANGQTFLNPLAYVPFYWMVTAEWHSTAIASVLAIFHALNLVVIYFILKQLLPHQAKNATAFHIAGTVLALLSPIYLIEVGTTFADVTTSLLLATAVLLALRASPTANSGLLPFLFCGLLAGAAGGLKLSNLVFAPAIVLFVLLLQNTVKRSLLHGVFTGLGMAIGFVLVASPWGWTLWKETGNPFFPLFGGLFPSVELFPRELGGLSRFTPESFLGALLLPFRMTHLRSWIHVETVAPDLRFAMATLLLCIVIAVYATRRYALRSTSVDSNFRTVFSFYSLVISSYILWLATSANGRYGLFVSLLIAPLIVVFLARLANHNKTAVYSLALLAVVQLLHISNADLRWGGAPWTKTWYDAAVPEKLRSEPYLHIIIGRNSNSFVMPFFDPRSAFTNPIGQNSVELEGYSGAKLRHLFDKYKNRVRVIAVAPRTDDDEPMFDTWANEADAMIGRLGFAIDRRDCEIVSTTAPSVYWQSSWEDMDKFRQRFRSCLLREHPYEFSAERARVKKLLSNAHKWCPKLFKAVNPTVERTSSGWLTASVATDAIFVIQGEQIIGVFPRAFGQLNLGTLTEWEQGKMPDCDALPDKPREMLKID